MAAGIKDKGREKRKFVRYDYEAPVMILRKTYDENYSLERNFITQGRIRNYSMGGLYIESDQAFPPGTTLAIRVAGDESRGQSDYFVEVRWCKTMMRADGHCYSLGVEYAQTSQRAVFGFSYLYPDIPAERSGRMRTRNT